MAILEVMTPESEGASLFASLDIGLFGQREFFVANLDRNCWEIFVIGFRVAQTLEASIRIHATEHLFGEIFLELFEFVLWYDDIFITRIDDCSSGLEVYSSVTN